MSVENDEWRSSSVEREKKKKKERCVYTFVSSLCAKKQQHQQSHSDIYQSTHADVSLLFSSFCFASKKRRTREKIVDVERKEKI